MKYLIIIAAIALTGCESIPIGGDRGLGNHTYSLTDDGFVLDTTSVRGGPNVEYEKTGDNVSLKVTPSREKILLDFMEAMQ